MAEYTGVGETCLEETERPLLAQKGPTQARKAPNVPLQHPLPGSARPGWERCSPRVGGPAQSPHLRSETREGRGPARPGGGGRGGDAAARSRVAPPVAASERASQAGQCPAWTSAPSAVLQSRAAPKRGPEDSPDRAARRGLSPGGESPAQRLRRRPLKGEVSGREPLAGLLGSLAAALHGVGGERSALRPGSTKSLALTEAAKAGWREWNSPAPGPRPPLRELGLARDARFTPAERTRGIGRLPRAVPKGAWLGQGEGGCPREMPLTSLVRSFQPPFLVSSSSPSARRMPRSVGARRGVGTRGPRTAQSLGVRPPGTCSGL